jgi:hypothetical protein
MCDLPLETRSAAQPPYVFRNFWSKQSLARQIRVSVTNREKIIEIISKILN